MKVGIQSRIIKKINAELEQYDSSLLKKPQIIAANKIDLVEDEEALNAFMDFMEKEGRDVFPISAATRQGVEELLNETLNRIENYIPPEEDEIELFDFEKDEYDADYKKLEAFVAEDGAYELTGGQLLKIFRSTNFTDVGSMRYLYRYIVNKGGIDMLKELGLQEGDTFESRITNLNIMTISLIMRLPAGMLSLKRKPQGL